MSATFWNERYSALDYVYGTEPNDFIRAEGHRIPPGPVLCLAEGEGRNAVFVAALGHPTTAVDLSAAGLRKAAALAAKRGVAVDLVEADLATFEIPPRTYSGIVSVFAHVPPDVRKRVHAKVVRGLVTGGVFLLEAYRPEQIAFGTGGPRDPTLMMTRSDLERDLQGLDLVVLREIERDVHEGSFHGGRSATVQVVAVKR